MARRGINLRALPVWLQYAIALVVIALVVSLAWLVGRDRPVPGWLTHRFIPALGWVYLALCVYLIIYYAARRIGKR